MAEIELQERGAPKVLQDDLDCDAYRYLAGGSRKTSGMIGGPVALPNFFTRPQASRNRRRSSGGARVSGRAPGNARYLLLNLPEFHADVKSPIHSVVHGSRAMQTVFAKREMALLGVIVAAIVAFMNLDELFRSLRITSSDDYGCPEPIDLLHNYWLWYYLVYAIWGLGASVGFVWWHLVRQRPGCTYRRWFVGFFSVMGPVMICVAAYGAVLVGVEAEQGSLDPKFCVDQDDPYLDISISYLLSDFTFGLGFTYVFLWQGAIVRNEPRAFFVFCYTIILSGLLVTIANTVEDSLLLAVMDGLLTLLMATFTASLPIRHRRMRRRLAQVLTQDRDEYNAAWSEHAHDVETIRALVALCEDVPRAKPRQANEQHAAESGAAADDGLPHTTSRGFGRSFSRSLKDLFYSGRKHRSFDSAGRITDRFELFRRAYVFHELFEWHLRRVLAPGDSESAEFKMAPVKHPERVYLKIIRSYNGDWSQVTDMIRCSAIYDTLPELLDSLRRLKDDPAVDIVQVKNRFDPSFDVSQLGYRDLKMLVTLPGISHGYVAEVQLHLRSIIEVKSGEGHKAYVHARDALGG